MADFALLLIPPGAVLRTLDGAIIPADPMNVDYQAFLAWQAAGNTPDPAPPVPPLRRLRAGEFLDRFSGAEQLALFRLTRTNDTVQLAISLAIARQQVDLDSSGLTNLLQALVTAGVLTAARVPQITA